MKRGVEEMVFGDPRGRTEEDWLDVLEHLVHRLSDEVQASVEIGAYWCDTGTSQASAALGARLRADAPLLWTGSDCWEATLCITGGEKGAYVDVIAFPFLRGSTITRAGRLEDIPGEPEVDELWLHYAEGRWLDKGWRYPDGPGEWDYVRAPGRHFFRRSACRVDKAAFARSEPVRVHVEQAQLVGLLPGSPVSLSIHQLKRDGREIVSPPPISRLPRPGSPESLRPEEPALPSRIRLDTAPIPGGWGAGRYELTLRINSSRGTDSRDSDLSEPIQLEITGP